MKKLLTVLFAMALVLGMTGFASAHNFSCPNGDCDGILFTDTHYFEQEVLGITVPGTTLLGKGELAWDHSTPSDFEVPYDNVLSAELLIKSSYVNDNNDKIFVETIFQGKLNNGGGLLPWNWETTTFDIGEIFTAGWVAGDDFNVMLKYKENGFLNSLTVWESTFTLCYDNESAPVPEPGTIILLGFGLLGMVTVGRKKISAKK